MDLFTFDNLVALLTLTSLEVVLGIDNVIFIAILAGRLPESQRDFARKLGLAVAVISRVSLLFAISWVVKLVDPLFTLYEHEVSGKDLILLGGGLFLMFKATKEIHHKVTGDHHAEQAGGKQATLSSMLAQVIVIDVVFSLDSVITAVGMVQDIRVMIAAVLASVAIMLAFSGPVVRFVDKHPSIKLLALSFLLMIGVLLIAEGFHKHFDKGYVYFAMAFSLAIELLSMRAEANADRLAARSDD